MSFLLLLSAGTSVASDSVSNLLSESIYLLELLIIAIVTIALIMITVSIAKSRHKVSQVALDLREEMGQERAILQITMNSIREKEEQITYLAHLLQEHLEGDVNTDNREPAANSAKKKVRDDGYIDIVEVVSELGSHPIENKTTDPRTVSADGSIKQAHFGPEQYLDEVESYQLQAQQHLQALIKQTNLSISNVLFTIRSEIEVIRVERARLNDFVVAIESNINQEDTLQMNSKDQGLVHRIIDADKQLHELERQQQRIEKKYAEAVVQDDVIADCEQEKVEAAS